MAQHVRGVIARAKGEPVELTTIVVPDPGPGEAVVDIQACGVCHTDLHYREGGINDDFPFLLGHEAAGVVESVGEGVTEVAPGDYVILNWRAVCGQCRACKRGRPQYCFDTHNAKQKMTLLDGTELTPALGIGAFADKTLVAAGQCTKVDPAASPAAAGLLGCGVMAYIGAAINTGNVGRGDSVAVIGCGGVGDAAVAGARLAGARRIIAVDIDDRKLEKARSVGATHTVNSREADPVEAIRELTDGFGADVVIEAVEQARDLPAGVLRPRPGKHRRPGRRPHPRDERRAAPPRRLRPRRRPQVLLVRGLPALPGLPDADRPLPPGAARPRRVRHRDRRPGRRRGGVRPDARRRRAALGGGPLMAARIEHLVTSGTFSLDGGTWDVDNNVWIVGDDTEVIVIDAAHDAAAIAAAVGERKLVAIVSTHAHDDHIDAAPALADRYGAPILLHPDDLVLWDQTHPARRPDADLADGRQITVAGTTLTVLHTPGHSPGAVSLYAPELHTVFSGDTLFQGGPGATGRSFSDFPTIVASIRDRLLTLPEATVVRTGHGDTTTVGEEAPHLDEWIARGH